MRRELWKGLKTLSDLALLLAQPASDWKVSMADLAPRTAKAESIKAISLWGVTGSHHGL